MLTEKDYCDYDTSIALYKLGYDCQVIHLIAEKITLYEAQKWLREEKKICVEIDCCASGYTWELCKAYHGGWFSGGTTIYTHYCEDNLNNPLLNNCGKYESYEDALLEGIKEAVKILAIC